MKYPLLAIFFDIDDTLYSTSEFAKAARLNSVHAMINAGLRMKTADCFRQLNEIIVEFGPNFSNHYDKLLERTPQEWYEGVNRAIIIAAGAVAYHETKFKELKPYEDVVEAFQIISKTDLMIGIITTGLEIKQAEKLIRLKLLKYIKPEAIFITGQLGIDKIDPQLYKNACDSLQLPPQSCMYIGDNPLNDIDPPNEIGMITVLNRRSGKYLDVKSKTKPKYTIHDMWELLDILRRDYAAPV
ncbi:MAG: HAD-IA family hydrolase [Candidatus Schekmanbacteria bacterium]|nr:HAD-IA family hydrolase [Candidatus Schekmanbacteria bacterium]